MSDNQTGADRHHAGDHPGDQPDDQQLRRQARRCGAALETVHVVAYLTPEPTAAYKELGLSGRAGYFASRSAAMGPVDAPVTIATFYVFAPSLVASCLPAAWDTAAPAEVLRARYAGTGRALHRILGDPDVGEAVELARVVCDGLHPQGRTLYASHADLPWPDEPLLALWHASALIREHRGDGHVATLLTAPLDPVEAIVLGGLRAGNTDFMRKTRGWTEPEWSAAEDRLRRRNLLDPSGRMTERGQAFRDRVEEQTDVAALEGWEHLGAAGASRLLELVTPLRRRILAAGGMPAWLSSRPEPVRRPDSGGGSRPGTA
ncbi:MAG: SCO6745 family protein [Nocardioidaceae bacterium]